MRSPLIVIATFVAMTSLVLVSRADPPRRSEDPKQLAREHVVAARTLHAQHRLSEALSELEAAYALDPQPQLLFAIGQLHVQAGRCERAIVFYQRFLAQKPKPNEAAIAREAIQTCKTAPPPAIDPTKDPTRDPRREQPTREQPTRTPDMPVTNAPPQPAMRRLDGLPVTSAPSPQRSLDGLPVTSAPPPRATPSPADPARSATGAVDRRGHLDPDHRRGSRASYVVAGSLTVAALGAAAGSLLLYRGALDDREAAASARSYDAYEDLVARSERRHRLSLVAGAAGAAALTSSVIVFVLSRRSGSRPTAAALQIIPSSNGAIATWSAPF